LIGINLLGTSQTVVCLGARLVRSCGALFGLALEFRRALFCLGTLASGARCLFLGRGGFSLVRRHAVARFITKLPRLSALALDTLLTAFLPAQDQEADHKKRDHDEDDDEPGAQGDLLLSWGVLFRVPFPRRSICNRRYAVRDRFLGFGAERSSSWISRSAPGVPASSWRLRSRSALSSAPSRIATLVIH
jgi:hypothetical protein